MTTTTPLPRRSAEEQRRLDATLTDKLEAQLNFLSKPEGADFKTGPAFKDPTLPLDIAMGLACTSVHGVASRRRRCSGV